MDVWWSNALLPFCKSNWLLTEWNPGFSTSGNAEGSYDHYYGVRSWSVVLLYWLPWLNDCYLFSWIRISMVTLKPTIEVLAGIPTIVYGVWWLLVHSLKLLVLILVSKNQCFDCRFRNGNYDYPVRLSDDIITQVPRALRDGSLGQPNQKQSAKWFYQQLYYRGIFIGCIACRRGNHDWAAGNSPLLHANPFEAVSM